jgi:hypothetical protein
VPLGHSSDARNTRNQSLATHEECTKNGKPSRVAPLHSRTFLTRPIQVEYIVSSFRASERHHAFFVFQSDVAPNVSDVVCILDLTREVACETFLLSLSNERFHFFDQ